VDVSRAPGAQSQVAIASSPSGEVQLAAANSLDPSASQRGIRVVVYSSTDAGANWRTSSPDSTSARRCSTADPATAVGDRGAEIVAFVVRLCSAPLTFASLGVDVVRRSGPQRQWSRATVAPIAAGWGNDKPAVAIDTGPASPHHGRVYVTWSRWYGRDTPIRIALSSSDDGGRTWTQPRVVAGVPGAVSAFSSLAVGRDGVVYLGWTDNARRVLVARSADGGASFGRPVLVSLAVGPPSALCGYSGVEIEAQPRRCITTDPSVAVARGRVYVTWTGPGRDHVDQDVYVRGFTPALAPATGAVPVTDRRRSLGGDQFLAASGYDSAGGRLWVCFYDTAGQPSRRQARYTCTASRDGTAWAQPVAAASVASDETVDEALDAGYGDYEGVVAAHGVAHPIWTDGRDLRRLGEEIYTTRLRAAALTAG
jgi:hypothetical protein